MNLKDIENSAPGIIEYPVFKLRYHYKWLRTDEIDGITFKKEEVIQVIVISSQKTVYRVLRISDNKRYTIERETLRQRLIDGTLVEIMDINLKDRLRIT